MRGLMTDVIEVWRAPAITTNLGETVYRKNDATLTMTGIGTLQLYFSAEYDTDRDTRQRLGRIISDDPVLYDLHPKDWILVDDVWYEIDGWPQKWTLRGLHHIECNVKSIEG